MVQACLSRHEVGRKAQCTHHASVLLLAGELRSVARRLKDCLHCRDAESWLHTGRHMPGNLVISDVALDACR